MPLEERASILAELTPGHSISEPAVQELLCYWAAGRLRCEIAGEYPLENVAQVTRLEFLAARQVGVPRSRAGDDARVFRARA